MAEDPELERRYRRLLEDYTGPLRRLCAAYHFAVSDQDDLLQDIAMALWSALPRFRGDASERTWLYRIAHNVAFAHLRTQTRRARHETSLTPGVPDPVETRDPRHELLLDAVRRLPDVDRQLATLYLEGLTGLEIESITGMSANNVAVRLSRLRKKLAETLHAPEVTR